MSAGTRRGVVGGNDPMASEHSTFVYLTSRDDGDEGRESFFDEGGGDEEG